MAEGSASEPRSWDRKKQTYAQCTSLLVRAAASWQSQLFAHGQTCVRAGGFGSPSRSPGGSGSQPIAEESDFSSEEVRYIIRRWTSAFAAADVLCDSTVQEAEEQNETNSLILVGHGGVMGVTDGAPPATAALGAESPPLRPPAAASLAEAAESDAVWAALLG